MTPRPTLRPNALLAAPLVLSLAGVLTACGGSTGTGTAHNAATSVAATGPASAQVAEVKGDTNLTFVPSEVDAKAGTLTLTLGNIGGTPHNLVFADTSLPRIAIVGAGESKSATLVLPRPGTYAFVCTIHSGMAGKVVVS